jgi:hypothetical protein
MHFGSIPMLGTEGLSGHRKIAWLVHRAKGNLKCLADAREQRRLITDPRRSVTHHEAELELVEVGTGVFEIVPMLLIREPP